jgi:hypothetical protein
MKFQAFVCLFLFICINNCFAQEFLRQDLLDDVAIYYKTIKKEHVNPFIHITEKQFKKAFENLKSLSPKLNDDQFLVGLLRLNALLKDEHTSIDLNEKEIFPIRFYWFEEGIIAVSVPMEDSAFAGSRLTAINNIEIDSVINMLKELTGVGTFSAEKFRIPNLISDPIIMHGLTLTTDDYEINFSFVNNKSETKNLKLKPGNQKREDFYKLIPLKIPLSNSKKSAYWINSNVDNKILFVQYNRCINEPKYPFENFMDDFKKTVISDKPNTLIVDLRFNSGGASNIFVPFVNMIAAMPELTGKKIYTIIGRRTFSSAVINAWQMKTVAHSILIGEETGGKLNHTGEVKSFTLPKTKINIYYSTKEWKFDKTQTGGILPYYEIKYSYKDYTNGIDPALDYIFKLTD